MLLQLCLSFIQCPVIPLSFLQKQLSFSRKNNRSIVVDKTIDVTYTFKVNKDGEFLTNV